MALNSLNCAAVPSLTHSQLSLCHTWDIRTSPRYLTLLDHYTLVRLASVAAETRAATYSWRTQQFEHRELHGPPCRCRCQPSRRSEPFRFTGQPPEGFLCRGIILYYTFSFFLVFLFLILFCVCLLRINVFIKPCPPHPIKSRR